LADCRAIAFPATHHGFSAFVWLLKDYNKAAYTLDKRGQIYMATLLFKEHQTAFPKTILPAEGNIIWPVQDTDTPIKFGLLTLTNTTRSTVLPLHGQIPPQLPNYISGGCPFQCKKFFRLLGASDQSSRVSGIYMQLSHAAGLYGIRGLGQNR
jgi:hypothetical protein